MTHLDLELKQLREDILEMIGLAHVQLKKSKEALIDNDIEIAEEIIHNEKRMNGMELSIDRRCENIFALFQPVATDLRFVISMLKINSNLERIGDYCESFAKFAIDMNKPISDEAMKATSLIEIFDLSISMIDDIYTAYENEDSKLARKVYKKESDLKKLNKNNSAVVAKMIKGKTEGAKSLLFLFSSLRIHERIGGHINNLAEEIIFHLEAEVLKHRKLQKKLGLK